MGLGEVGYVDVVAEACAVGGGVVVAEDAEALALANGGLGYEGDQIVGHAAGKFADEGAGMRSDGVEVAEGDAVHAVRCNAVAQEVLAHLLGVAVGRRGGLAGRLLGDRGLFGLTVHGGGGGEEHVGAVLPGGLQNVKERTEVVLVVHERLGDRFADGLECGEVDDGVDVILVEKPVHGGGIAEIYVFEGQLAAEYGADALVVGFVTVGHVVGDDYVVACLRKLHGNVASDKSGSAGHKDCFLHNLQK